jgi:hypothetical protein
MTEPGPSQAEVNAGFERLLEPHSPDVAAAARALRASVNAALPEAVEQVDFGNKLLAIGRSMKMRDLMFAIIPHGAHVNLQLADGADLPNPDGRIEGTGKRIRHIKVRSADDAASAAVRAAIAAEIERHPA